MFQKDLLLLKKKLIEDNAVERFALVTKVWLCLHPMTKPIMLWVASQAWMTSLDVYVLIHKNMCVVLLTSKFSVRLGERIWRSPHKDVMYWNSSSRSDSRGFFVQVVFSCLVCQLGYLNTYSNYRLHLLSTVRPQIILTQGPYGLPRQEGTS